MFFDSTVRKEIFQETVTNANFAKLVDLLYICYHLRLSMNIYFSYITSFVTHWLGQMCCTLLHVGTSFMINETPYGIILQKSLSVYKVSTYD